MQIQLSIYTLFTTIDLKTGDYMHYHGATLVYLLSTPIDSKFKFRERGLIKLPKRVNKSGGGGGRGGKMKRGCY